MEYGYPIEKQCHESKAFYFRTEWLAAITELWTKSLHKLEAPTSVTSFLVCQLVCNDLLGDSFGNATHRVYHYNKGDTSTNQTVSNLQHCIAVTFPKHAEYDGPPIPPIPDSSSAPTTTLARVRPQGISSSLDSIDVGDVLQSICSPSTISYINIGVDVA